jgi:hypothetical protein
MLLLPWGRDMMKFLKALSPIQQGLVATLWFGGVMALFRIGYGAFDPEFRTWAPVAIAPLFGLSRYVSATGRNPFPPELMIAIGYVALLVYAKVFVKDGLPGPLGEWILWGLIVALPVAVIVWGVVKIRRRGTLPASNAGAPRE